jgi:hypothetical protein
MRHPQSRGRRHQEGATCPNGPSADDDLRLKGWHPYIPKMGNNRSRAGKQLHGDHQLCMTAHICPARAWVSAHDRMCSDLQPQAHHPAPLCDLTVADEAELLEQGLRPGMEVRTPLRRPPLDLLGVGLNEATTGGTHGIQRG